MTTPRPTPFIATTPRARVFALFVIISNFDDEITTLPVRPTPLSPDRTPALYGYLLDSGDHPSEEDQRETAESLHTQIASTLIPSSSLPPSLLPSSSSPPPSLLPSLSRKRFRSPLPSPSPSPSVSPSPLPSLPPATPPPPPEHIELVGDDIETLCASLASAMQKTMTLRARVGLLEQNNVVTQDSLRISRGRITRSQLRAVYAQHGVRKGYFAKQGLEDDECERKRKSNERMRAFRKLAATDPYSLEKTLARLEAKAKKTKKMALLMIQGLIMRSFIPELKRDTKIIYPK
ncbi:hypothetical protein Tco_0739193, partial [Tanacetum coccineum]